MKNILFYIPFIIISCQSKLSTEKKYEVTYNLLIEQNNSFSKILKENIEEKIKAAKFENVKIKIYNSLTNDYLHYLSLIEIELEKNGSDIFFENDEYSKIGKEYLRKTKVYKSKIKELIVGENLKQRIDFVLGTDEIKVVDNNDVLHIFYLDYYFKGFPKSQSIAFVNSKKKTVLEFENEFLDELLINKVK